VLFFLCFCTHEKVLMLVLDLMGPRRADVVWTAGGQLAGGRPAGAAVFALVDCSFHSMSGTDTGPAKTSIKGISYRMCNSLFKIFIFLVFATPIL